MSNCYVIQIKGKAKMTKTKAHSPTRSLKPSATLRCTVTINNDDSTTTVRPNSPSHNQQVGKITKEEQTKSRSAPNTTEAKRHLLLHPRYR